MKEIKTDKGFLIMQVSRKELMDALGEMTLGRCDFILGKEQIGTQLSMF